MKVKSEKLKVVKVEHKVGKSRNGNDYDFTILYSNMENGIQEQIIIPNELAEKCKEGKNVQIIYEVAYGRIYAKEIEQCQ